MKSIKRCQRVISLFIVAFILGMIVLVVKIQHGEGQLVIVTGAVHGGAPEILKSVVHPA